MIYLITHLGLWLFLTAAFAALAGWAAAASRAQPAEALALREREKLMKDLLSISVDNAPNGVPVELDREMDTLRRRADLDAARVSELERALETARANYSEATSRVAELERFHGIEDQGDDDDHEELERLRAELAALNAERARTVDVEAIPVQDDSAALMAWRLRYFEQRARYLENHNHQPAPEPVAETDAPVASGPVVPLWEWRARVAEAQVEHYEEERRALADAAPAPVEETTASPFAADAEADMLLRWRMLYLEKRVAHLQGEQLAADALPAAMNAEEAEAWKWRSRYLEARTRHLESKLGEAQSAIDDAAQRAASAESVRETHVARIAELEAAPPVIIAPTPAPVVATREPALQPLVPAGAERRPSGLAAPRNGAGDDLSLIEGISLLQHRTLNSLGIHHFDQIAAWTPANVAWVDQYLRLRGRISQEEWVEQAQALAREGVSAARKLTEEEAL